MNRYFRHYSQGLSAYSLETVNGVPCECFTVASSDSDKQRYEINPNLGYLGDTIQYQFTTYIPNQDTQGRDIGFINWHHDQSVKPPFSVPYAIRYNDGKIRIKHINKKGNLFYVYEEQCLDAWMKWTVQVHWRNDDLGWIKFYINGNLIHEFHGQTSFDNNVPYFKYGTYAWDIEGLDVSFKIYFRDILFTQI